MAKPKSEMVLTDEETARHRDELAKHMLNMPPQPLKPKRKATPGQISEKRKQGKTFQLLFDIESLQTRFESMSTLELNFLQESIKEGRYGAFDIFIADSMPAVSAGGPEKILIGFRFNF
jgi:hypothetical protein